MDIRPFLILRTQLWTGYPPCIYPVQYLVTPLSLISTADSNLYISHIQHLETNKEHRVGAHSTKISRIKRQTSSLNRLPTTATFHFLLTQSK